MRGNVTGERGRAGCEELTRHLLPLTLVAGDQCPQPGSLGARADFGRCWRGLQLLPAGRADTRHAGVLGDVVSACRSRKKVTFGRLGETLKAIFINWKCLGRQTSKYCRDGSRGMKPRVARDGVGV